MKIVFDTNVLIAAFLSSGGTSQVVFAEAVQNHTVVLSDYILGEFKRIPQTKLDVPGHVVNAAIQEIKKDVFILGKVSLAGVHFSDKADIPILALTKAARAQVLVTGDKNMLALKRFFKAVIVSPREAMEMI